MIVLVGEEEPERYPRMALRWLERLLGELELGEAPFAAGALVALRGRSSAQAVTVLREVLNRPPAR